MKKNQIIILLFLISFPFLTFALENDYQGLIGDQTESFLEYIIKMAISFGVISAVLVIIYQGINIIIAQGELAKIIIAKERIKAVFIGLIILLGIYVLAVTVNPDLSIIKLEQLRNFVNETFKWSNNENQNKIEFQEVPLGSIVESILAANSSKRIENVKDETEELCYTYNENGDTIDRNGDGRITPEGDTLRGVDMFYCIQELNQAIVKKVSALNGDYLCKGENVDGPMRRILKLIESQDEDGNYNCRCSNCANYSYLQVSYACQTITEECEVCDADNNCDTKIRDVCDSKCSCCGSAYYKPNFGCQTSNFFQSKINDPCGQDTRDQIDCARNEIKLRIDGQNYDDMPPGAVADKCSFTALWPDMEYNFLTLDLAIQRMKSFEEYYNNHLVDLDKAIFMMRNPTGERISLAEFHTLQGQNIQGKEIDSMVFPNVNNANYDYSPIKYCKDFNCTLKNNKDVCLMGERSILTDVLYQKELENDPCDDSGDGFCKVYDSETEEYIELKDKRIYSVDEEENKEGFSYNGDGMTFYYKEGFKYEESKEKERFYLETSETEKGYMESLIPLGDVVNDARNFANKLLEFTGEIRKEVESVKTKAMEFADLPEKCDCSLNCSTYPTLGGIESCNNMGPEQCPDNSCDDCSTCSANKKGQCICCEECETIEVLDSAYYYCLRSKSAPRDLIGNLPYVCRDPFFNDNDNSCFGQQSFFVNNSNCSISAPDESTEALVLNPYAKIVGEYCSCPGNYWYVEKNNSICIEKLMGTNNSPGVICSQSKVNNILAGLTGGQYGSQYIASGTWCSCMYQGSFIGSDKTCYNPNTGEATSCTIDQLTSGEIFSKDSDCYAMAEKLPNYCLNQVESISTMGAFWNMISCVDGVIKFEPSVTRSVTICEGEESNTLTEEDKESIKNLNSGIDWVDEDTLTYNGLNCCNMYYAENGKFNPLDQRGEKQVITLPSGFDAMCVVEGGDHKINITKLGATASTLSQRGVPTKKDYYVCPYNELKDKQCRIFKYSNIFNNSSVYPEDQVSGLDCTNVDSHGIGHLQKIELLAKRISDYGEGRNLKTGDPNRWEILDILNLSRQKLEKCITGYGYPFKKDMVKNRLLSCEESIDTVVLGTGVIYPDFPYPVSDNKWNCGPFNSSYVEVNQQISCRNNKELPACRDAIKNLIDDYYCFYGQ